MTYSLYCSPVIRLELPRFRTLKIYFHSYTWNFLVPKLLTISYTYITDKDYPALIQN